MQCRWGVIPLFARLGKRNRYRILMYVHPTYVIRFSTTRLPMHEARHRIIRRNPRSPAYRETGHPCLGGTQYLCTGVLTGCMRGVRGRGHQVFDALRATAAIDPSTNPLRGRTHWQVEMRSRVTVGS